MEGAVALHTIRQGAGPARPLVIAHGLFGSARNWGRIARDLSDRGPVIAADMRNHGVSPWTNHHDYAGMAADLAALIAAEDQPCDVLGHSMGGKAAMVLAIAQPELVARLVIADIAPIAYEHSQAHLVAAMRGVALDTVQTRRDADAALATAVPDPGTRAFLLHALDMQSHPPRWRLNLAHRLAQRRGAVGHHDPGRFHRFDLVLGAALAARDDGARMAHPTTRRRGAARDEARRRLPPALLLLVGEELRRLFLGASRRSRRS
jgi:esterase